jgi:U-box domain
MTDRNSNNKNNDQQQQQQQEQSIEDLFNNPTVLNSLPTFSKPPVEFICPLETGRSMTKTMRDPVQSLSTGITYERSSIDMWRAEHGDVCPVTGQTLGFLVPHQQLKERIVNWKQQVKGLRRIRRKSPTTFCIVDTSLTCTSLGQGQSHMHGGNGSGSVGSDGSGSVNSAPTTNTRTYDRNERKKKKKTAPSPATPTIPIRPSNDKFAQVDALLSSFVEAGISDYRRRVKERKKQGIDHNLDHDYNDNDDDDDDDDTFNDGNNKDDGDDEDQMSNNQIRYTYNAEFYPSIFSRGPRFVHSHSI